MSLPVIAIYDVGKTNKKLFLLNEQYGIELEESMQLPEIADEDGFPCEDLNALTAWIRESFARIQKDTRFDIAAVNFSTYGASFVHLNDAMQPCLPLYNYLKPYPEVLARRFYDAYGGDDSVAKQTASPVLGSLNSGLQLYRLKYEHRDLYDTIRYSLHLPQYLSFLFSDIACSDITSIGCHTHLWDFEQSAYHKWVHDEQVMEKLAPVVPCNEVVKRPERVIGCGLHDSSAALIPYLAAFHEPFILLSTGTWCISMNPFNDAPLTEEELHSDCLCYLTYQGTPVKASRLFAGHAHEQQTKRLASYFNVPNEHYKRVACDIKLLDKCLASLKNNNDPSSTSLPAFGDRPGSDFPSYEEAYHMLMADLVQQQIASSNLVLKGTPVRRIFVDGGFSNNSIYMNLLASALPQMEAYAASVAQASAMGAALAIHQHWNTKPLPSDIITLKYYSAVKSATA